MFLNYFVMNKKKILWKKICDENSKSLVVTQLTSKLWKNLKTQNVMYVKNSNCNKTQKLKWWQSSRTEIVTELKNSKCDKTQKLMCVKIQKPNMWQNLLIQIWQNSETKIFEKLKTQYVTKFKNSICDYTKNSNKTKLISVNCDNNYT